MADDSGQRLLDVIGDPSALDEFLGALTSDTVPDNVVESLARSLAAEFDNVDSPNEALFDSSSANLTDISQSTVPFDFGSTTSSSNDLEPHNSYHHSSRSSDLISIDYKYSHAQYNTEVSFTNSNSTGQAVQHLHHHNGPNTAGESTNSTAFKSSASATSSSEVLYNQTNCKSEPVTTPHVQNEVHPSLSTPVSDKVTPSISATVASTVQATSATVSQQRPHLAEPTLTPAQTNATTNGPTHVYVTTSTEQTQYASLGHLVQAQQNAAVLAGMNQQLALNTQQGASFIIDPTTGQPMMVAAGGNTFGTTNLLVAGVQPTYAMLPAQTSLFSNAITMQPQIQAIKTAHGTAAGFIQATTTGVQNAGNSAQTSTTSKPKAPPQLLPKPNGGGTTPTSTSSDHVDPNAVTNSVGTTSTGSNVVVTSTGSITMTTESLSQILQQQQGTVTNAGGVSLAQPSFAIGAGGQVVQVSGMQTLNSISGSQIFMNQFGQQMIVPTAMGQGVQFIVRQQPQPQMLTIQAPAASAQQATTANGKVVRFVQAAAPVPQVTQNSIQLQQIQTAQGTTWVAVRSAPVQPQPVVSIQPPSPVVVAAAKTPTPPPPPPTPPQPPPVVQVTTDTISATIQSVIERLKSPSPPLTTTVQTSTPILSVSAESTPASGSTTADHQPPPKKKPKYSKKKKVTLDLEQLLKQSGIMDEDLQDDTGFSFGDFFSSPAGTAEESGGSQSEESSHHNGIHNNNNNTTTQKDFYKPNGATATAAVPFVPTVPPHSHILKPSTKSKQRKNAVKVEPPPSPSPPAPLPTTPKQPAKKSKKKSPATPAMNIKVERSSPPPVDTPPASQVPPVAKTPAKSKKKKKNAAESPSAGGILSPSVTSNVTATVTPTVTPKKSKPKKKKVEVKVEPEECGESMQSPAAGPLANMTVSPAPVPAQPRRIVQTIQLTPQNQNLLRNIQAQIQKLLSLTTRNEVEEMALQKFICLQAEVIKTGTPVPNPPHLQTMTSSAGNIIPTTTISMSVPGRGMNNGLSNGVYYNSLESDVGFIDEKRLEEQMMARLEIEEEARIQWRKEEFEKRLAQDHQFFLNPEHLRPFSSLDDVAERFLHYHVARDTAEITFEEFDEDFAETSCQLLNKFTGMLSKYRALLLKESMNDVECAESVMLERMFVAEERLKLEHDRGLVQQGEILELPPPPPIWVPRIRQMVEAEMKEMERDSLANQQVQSAIDSIMSFEPNGTNLPVTDDKEKIEYDAFGVPISTSNYNNLNSSSADIDEAVRSILL